MRGLTTLIAVSAFVPFSTLSAQQPRLELGARVRVLVCPRSVSSGTVCQRSVGTLSALTAESMTVLVGNNAGESAIALESVTRLDVSRGQRRPVARGALLGLGIGVGVGAVGGAVAEMGGAQFCIDTCGSRGVITAASAAFFGASGLVMGTVVGALIKTDRWEEVPLDQLSVSIAPQRDRVSFGLRIAF